MKQRSPLHHCRLPTPAARTRGGQLSAPAATPPETGREAIDGGDSIVGNAPQPWEMGFKDTVISYPGEITRIKMKFDLAGFYVWHCHIVEHEDNEMMRPFHIGPIPPDAPAG